MNQITTKSKFLYDVAEIFANHDLFSLEAYFKDIAGNQPEAMQHDAIQALKGIYVYLLFGKID